MNADRSSWPVEAVRLADENSLPTDAIFYQVIVWPNDDAHADSIALPRLPRGQQTYRWMPVKLHTQGKVYIYAQKWNEREGVVEAGKDVRDVKAVTAMEPGT